MSAPGRTSYTGKWLRVPGISGFLPKSNRRPTWTLESPISETFRAVCHSSEFTQFWKVHYGEKCVEFSLPNFLQNFPHPFLDAHLDVWYRRHWDHRGRTVIVWWNCHERDDQFQLGIWFFLWFGTEIACARTSNPVHGTIRERIPFSTSVWWPTLSKINILLCTRDEEMFHFPIWSATRRDFNLDSKGGGTQFWAPFTHP